MFPLVWEVTEALELYDIPVVSITSDGAKPNRRFYSMCTRNNRLEVPYKTYNPFREEEDIFFFCDPPHLLKTARNCFSNSFAHSGSRKMQVTYYLNIRVCTCNYCVIIFMCECIHSHGYAKKKGQTISWKWIERLYLMESSTETPGVRLCHKLTRDHVWLTSFTRMRVNLAAQVRLHLAFTMYT